MTDPSLWDTDININNVFPNQYNFLFFQLNTKAEELKKKQELRKDSKQRKWLSSHKALVWLQKTSNIANKSSFIFIICKRVAMILQNLFCISQRIEHHMGLEQH